MNKVYFAVEPRNVFEVAKEFYRRQVVVLEKRVCCVVCGREFGSLRGLYPHLRVHGVKQ